MKIRTITFALLPLLLASCSNDKSATEPELQTEFEYRQTMPAGDGLTDESRGKEIWLSIGAISGLADSPANGVVQSHYFDSGVYQHGMQINIQQADAGYFYEGWLVNPKNGNVISTGKISPLFNDVRHALRFESAKDLRDYTKVIVTLEPDDGNPEPAKHVAEAVLKEVQR